MIDATVTDPTVGQLGRLSEFVNAIPSPLSPSGIFLYGVGGVLLLVGIAKLNQRQTGEDSAAASQGAETVDLSSGLDELELTDVGEQQRSTLAPDAVDFETRAARVGDQWTSTLHMASLPDYPKDGCLSGLFKETNAEFDITCHIEPRDHESARAELQNLADNLQADADLERTSRRRYLQDRAQQAKATHQAVEEGEEVFDVSMFVTVRGDTREEMQEARQKLMGKLRDRPAFMEPKVAVCRQRDALRSAAPLGGDDLERDHVALGGAVGALLASPHNPTILEEGGVEMGVHRDTGSPIVVDPFERDDGYAMFVVGDTGSGKSFSSKMNFIRSLEQSEDRIGYILEPMGNWAGVSEALGAERVSIGGDKTVNPLEIRKPPAHVRQAMAEDENPLRARIDRSISWFMLFFSLREAGLGDRRSTLERALWGAYGVKGITDDIGTHDRESPTMDTVFDVLDEMVENPDEFITRSEHETEKIRDDALWLLDQLSPFAAGGQFDHLNGHSEFDIRDAKTMYMDLGQQGGSMSSNTTLLMELLMSLVYEWAKETEKEVIFYIDEARYIMQDERTLEYLETIFRHHRHYDLSIRVVTQTIDEFLDSSVSKIILDQCAVKQFQKLDGMNRDIAKEFELNEAQMSYVQNATEGSDSKERKEAQSQALIGVDGEWRGVEVEALPREQAVIDFEPTEQQAADLPGNTGHGGARQASRSGEQARKDDPRPRDSATTRETETEMDTEAEAAGDTDTDESESDQDTDDAGRPSFPALEKAIDKAADEGDPVEEWQPVDGDATEATSDFSNESDGDGDGSESDGDENETGAGPGSNGTGGAKTNFELVEVSDDDEPDTASESTTDEEDD